MHYDALWINGSLATCDNGFGLIERAAIGVKEGKIAWIGEAKALPNDLSTMSNCVYDIANTCITPSFIDCHTHAVYAGNRAIEFASRLKGVSYETIASQGGGILSTVQATREACIEKILHESLVRVKSLFASGVTTIEIKSGYGLDLDTEIKILRVAKSIEEYLPINVHTTLLAAHTLPHEYQGRSDQYIDLVCNEMIPTIASQKLASAVDVFCEKIAFSLTQTERVFQTAKAHGLQIKCHAEQLSASGASRLAVKYQALSVDHLEYLRNEDVKYLKQHNTVAVLLPGAYYFLREKKLPPICGLRESGIPIAIASDCNPGTSPVGSMLLMLNMACTLFQLTPEEALMGVTKNAALALGIDKTHGSLTPGKAADMAVWNISHPAELAYYIGLNPLRQLIKNGKPVLAPS